MYDAPCSRVGHIYRGYAPFPNPRNGTNFIARNFKRVAAVWMDEFQEAVYNRKQDVKNIDPGDITKQLAVRERLQCKPFKWFMEEVANDMLEKYPVKDPPPFAMGRVKSVAVPHHCLDSLGLSKRKSPGLYPCHDLVDGHVSRTQDWVMSYARDFSLGEGGYCLDVQSGKPKPVFWECHENQGNELFRYDLVSIGAT